MLSKSEKKELLNEEPRFDDINSSLMVGQKLPKGAIKEVNDVVALARKFKKEVIVLTVFQFGIKTIELWIPFHFPNITLSLLFVSWCQCFFNCII